MAVLTKKAWFGPKRYVGWGWTPTRWQGWLVTEQDFTLVRFDIHEDGTFEVTGPRIRATGSLTLVGGLVRFSGTGLEQNRGATVYRIEDRQAG